MISPQIKISFSQKQIVDFDFLLELKKIDHVKLVNNEYDLVYFY